MPSNHAPLSVLTGHVSDAFNKILQYHLKHGATILDPTYGAGLLWQHVPDADYHVIATDALVGVEFSQVFMAAQGYLPVDAVVYDPPYMFGVGKSLDPRVALYGGYGQSYAQLLWYIAVTTRIIPDWLTSGGLLIIKCSDQYYTPEHKLYLHHVTWLEAISKLYNVLDFYIYKHDRVSPTAWQVNNRRSNVIMHTYFIVAELR